MAGELAHHKRFFFLLWHFFLLYGAAISAGGGLLQVLAEALQPPANTNIVSIIGCPSRNSCTVPIRNLNLWGNWPFCHDKPQEVHYTCKRAKYHLHNAAYGRPKTLFGEVCADMKVLPDILHASIQFLVERDCFTGSREGRKRKNQCQVNFCTWLDFWFGVLHSLERHSIDSVPFFGRFKLLIHCVWPDNGVSKRKLGVPSHKMSALWGVSLAASAYLKALTQQSFLEGYHVIDFEDYTATNFRTLLVFYCENEEFPWIWPSRLQGKIVDARRLNNTTTSVYLGKKFFKKINTSNIDVKCRYSLNRIKLVQDQNIYISCGTKKIKRKM